MIGNNPRFPKQIFRRPFPVIAPSDQSGNGKSHKGQRQQGSPSEGKIGKRGGGEAGGTEAQDRRGIFLDISHNNQTCYRAHNYGIPEYGGHGDQALPPGIPGFRRSGGDSCGSDSRFIGEKASGNAESCRALQRASDEAARCRLCFKSAADYQGETGKNKVTVQEQQIQTAANIEKTEGGNHSCAEFTDGFHPAQNDQAGGEGGKDTDNMGRNRSDGIYRFRDCRRLCGTAHPEGGKQGTGGIQDAQGFAVQPLLQYVHRSAHIGFIRFLFFEQHA